jgi:hypothetical protein
MRELFRRMTPKGELVVSALAWGSTIMATLQGPSGEAPRSIGVDVSPIEPPTEAEAGWFTHAIGAHPGTTVSITEAEHELIAALSEPEPRADADLLRWVRERAAEDHRAAKGVPAPLSNDTHGASSSVLRSLGGGRVNGTHVMHLRGAVRRELTEAYLYERERLSAESATLDSVG